MKLIAANAEESIAAVRGLSEGRIQRRLLTVPFTEFRAPVARATCAWEDLRPVRMVNTVSSARARAKDQVAEFKASKPGKFTNADFALFAGIELTTASNRLYNLVERGELVRAGKAGRNVIYKFA